MTKEVAIQMWKDFCKDGSTIPDRQEFIGDKIQLMVYDIPVKNGYLRVTSSNINFFAYNTEFRLKLEATFDLLPDESYELRCLFHGFPLENPNKK